MKVIGTIEPDFIDNEAHISNGDYAGGKIVQLSPKEYDLLGLLQHASENNAWHWSQINDVPFKGGNLSDAFLCIHTYIEAKFAVNEFQELTDRLKEILTAIEEK